MSQSPDDSPDGSGRPDDGDARPEPWAPDLDAGSADTEAAKPDESGAEARAAADRPDPTPTADAASPTPAETPPGERIAKAMARAGIASRRDAEAMILAGRVSVNGETLASPARNVVDDDRILVDGQPMPSRERSRLWIFHKPRGLVTTARDPEGRQTVFEVLPEDMPRVVAVGRLDINTEGLLLLTNDGGLAKVIAHPDTGWLRRYRVRAHGDTDQAQLDRLAKGVTIDGMEYGPIEATLDRVQGDNLWLTLGLREGKNREVKRILEHLGLSVNRLIRLSFGPFQLGDLEPGLVEEVRTRVLKDQLGKTLAAQAGVDFDSPVREQIQPFGGPAKRETAAAARPARDPARPARPQRVSTGGSGPGPRRSAWRADADEPRPSRVPRRGADPRAARASAAERGHERVGSIRAGERRVLVERLSATPAEPQPAEKPRRRYADRDGEARPQQGAGERPGRGDPGARSQMPRDGAGAGGGAGRREFGRSEREPASSRSNPRRGARPASDGQDSRRQDARRQEDRRQEDRRPGQSAARSERSPAAPRGQGGYRGAPGSGDARPRSGGTRGASSPGGGPGGRPGTGNRGGSGQENRSRGQDKGGGFGKGRPPGRDGGGRGGPGRGTPNRGGPGSGGGGAPRGRR